MNLNELALECFVNNMDWYRDPETGEHIVRNKGELIALIHSELSECLEYERKGGLDKHVPRFLGAEVEMADAVIRILDYCAYCGYDIDGAVRAKLEYNRTREDHRLENRAKEGGKKW